MRKGKGAGRNNLRFCGGMVSADCRVQSGDFHG